MPKIQEIDDDRLGFQLVLKRITEASSLCLG